MELIWIYYAKLVHTYEKQYINSYKRPYNAYTRKYLPALTIASIFISCQDDISFLATAYGMNMNRFAKVQIQLFDILLQYSAGGSGSRLLVEKQKR